MKAMLLRAPRQPLEEAEVPAPVPGPGQILVHVAACGVCRTDLHVVEGELPHPKLPLIPGHEIVGYVEAADNAHHPFRRGDRVGIPWLASTCGHCPYCRSDRENLCPYALFTGYTVDGGYAEFALADAHYAFALPDGYTDEAAAPLLCAGLIGYRCLRLAGDAARVGLYGFGAAAHLVAQIARGEGRNVFAFTRPGDEAARTFALAMGVDWAGDSTASPPDQLDAAIIFAPVGALVPTALARLAPGGCVVCGGIHMSDIPSFPYDLLWRERMIRSVANLTRRDAEEFLELAGRQTLLTHVHTFPLGAANEALNALRTGTLTGAAVLMPKWPPSDPLPGAQVKSFGSASSYSRSPSGATDR